MNYTVWGNFDESKAGHDEYYYKIRLTNLDFRGHLSISPLSYWGFGASVFTCSHAIVNGAYDAAAISKSVTVGDYAWICSQVILYNCIIEHHAIVSIGSVVRNMTVPAYHVAEGNPAKLIARWDLEAKRWITLNGELDANSLHIEVN